MTKLQQMQKYLISTVISTVTGILFDRRTMTVIMTAFHMFQVKQTTCSQLKCSDALKQFTAEHFTTAVKLMRKQMR